jgi:uncharacterized membrane protein
MVGGAILSLCLNLFLLGGMAATHLHGPHGGMFGRGERGGMVMATVPPELKSILRKKFMEQGMDFGGERERMNGVRARIAVALAAEPYDPVAFDAALADLQQAAAAMMDAAHKTLAEVAAGLSPEQRQLWAEGWRNPGRLP